MGQGCGGGWAVDAFREFKTGVDPASGPPRSRLGRACPHRRRRLRCHRRGLEIGPSSGRTSRWRLQPAAGSVLAGSVPGVVSSRRALGRREAPSHQVERRREAVVEADRMLVVRPRGSPPPVECRVLVLRQSHSRIGDGGDHRHRRSAPRIAAQPHIATRITAQRRVGARSPGTSWHG